MEEISHRTVEVNGISMHIAEKGMGGQVVLMLHGFPELWYSWRHQIIGLADKGYHAVAPDIRGFGDTDAPSAISSYSICHLVGDIVALINALGQEQVFVVGHDWGAQVAWYLCLFRPDKVKALVNLSVAYMPRNPAAKPVDYFRALYGDDYYVCRFQEPGVIESIFGSVSAEQVLKKFYYTLRDPSGIFIPKEGWISPNDEIPLPNWLSEEDFNYFGNKFEKSGWSGGVNYYRCLNSNWELTAPWTGAQIKVPTKFIVGDLDLTYHYPGIQDFIHNGGFKQAVPLLEEVVVMKGVAHFIQQEKAHEITQHILDFIKKF
ncbi:epoxide hydrolase A-like [Dioscorea cayenensis subsp. rotundata]|uniref:soluble epoxide hydrolase n=1 Tax=Dioscorea cayennensis subsp. rotundata TaxID=55577 RepID=A0AB40AJE3_DIOCR|nr:epoxide hydrolase A-like [Dioscorea cayenensis subsp. rotundata]